jgi:RNA 2',3'-cyclic 3'-phosphodiesterase
VVNSFRTFIAIELPHDLRARVVEHINKLRHEFPDVRASWLRKDNLHLTLKFLGDVPVTEIPKLSDAVARAASGIKPFELTVAGCGAFPPKGRPHVLWIGVGSADAPSTASPLSIIHSAIEDQCSKAGFSREQRPFHPHLTIARLRRHGDERRLAEAHQDLGFRPEIFSVSELVVFRSELLREGSKHTVLSRHQLSK